MLRKNRKKPPNQLKRPKTSKTVRLKNIFKFFINFLIKPLLSNQHYKGEDRRKWSVGEKQKKKEKKIKREREKMNLMKF
jgi:hypothetical protein